MPNIREILLTQLKSDFISSTWFPPFQESLEGLTYEHAKWKPGPNSNSILDIGNHLLEDNEWWFSLFNEKEYTRDDDFWKSEENWSKLLMKLSGFFDEWKKIITESTEEKLNSVISPSDKRKWWELISYEMIHISYHIGQIIYIRKLQDNWVNKY